MTRKRFKKLCMSMGRSRNEADTLARLEAYIYTENGEIRLPNKTKLALLVLAKEKQGDKK